MLFLHTALVTMTYLIGCYPTDKSPHSIPPYNVVKESDTKWRVEMALAGWSREEIEISTETNVLCVKSKSEKDSEDEFIHRGVAKRAFSRSFNISDDVEVGDVTYKDGLLAIRLTKIVPEKQKKKVYEIT